MVDERSTELAELAVDAGVFAVIAGISPIDRPSVYGETMRIAYWDRKNARLAADIAVAGISRLLADAHRTGGTESADLRSVAKALAYDTASFSWSGWDEPGIDPSSLDPALGLSAARLNLSLALELDKDEIALSRAHWILGAHFMTCGHYQEADTAFTAASIFADASGAGAEAALARAFGALNEVASGSSAAGALLDTAIDQLEGMPDGPAFVAQVRTAQAVLGLPD